MGATPLILVGSALMGTGSIGQFNMTRAGGKIERMELETAAEMEELGATQREADRKARLAEALASQIASAGASGVSAFEGSPLTILQADIAKEEKATQRDVFMTGLKSEAYKMRGKMAEKIAKQKATMGLMANVGQMGLQAGMGLR